MPSSAKPATRRSRSTRASPAIPEKRQLNAWDSAFLYLDTPETPMYGGFLHLYAGVPGETSAKRFQRPRGHIARCLDSSPVFRRRVVRSPLDLDAARAKASPKRGANHDQRRQAAQRKIRIGNTAPAERTRRIAQRTAKTASARAQATA